MNSLTSPEISSGVALNFWQSASTIGRKAACAINFPQYRKPGFWSSLIVRSGASNTHPSRTLS